MIAKTFIKILVRTSFLLVMVVLGFTAIYPRWLDNREIIYAELFNDGIIDEPEYITLGNKRILSPNYASKELFSDNNLYKCIKEKNTKLALIKILNCSNRNIASLDGIELLTHLKNLNVSHNAIKKLPNSQISGLYIDLSYNDLVNVDLIPLLSHQSVDLSNNQIKEVVFSDKSLKGFARFSTYNKTNRLNSIQYPVTSLKNLNTYFRLNNNNLNEHDFKELAEKGIVFQAFDPSIEFFPDKRLRECLSNATGYSEETIVSLKCNGKNNPVFNTKGINRLKNITYLDLSNNLFNEIKLTDLKKIKFLKLNNNDLTNINLINNKNLEALNLTENNLENISFFHLKKLYKFNMKNPTISPEEEYQFISQLNVSKSVSPSIFPSKVFRECIIRSVVSEGKTFSHITNLSCFNNTEPEFFSLEGIQYLHNLKKILISHGKIKSINFSSNQLLSQMQITDSSIMKITLPSFKTTNSTIKKTLVNLENINLKELVLNFPCNIDTLNLTNNKVEDIQFPINCRINNLNLRQNSINEINLNSLINTVNINLSNNKLKRVNLNKLSNLDSIRLNDNLLINLDLSSNLKLEMISIANNPLTYHDIRLNPKWKVLLLDYKQLDLFRKKLGAESFKYQKDVEMFALYNN